MIWLMDYIGFKNFIFLNYFLLNYTITKKKDAREIKYKLGIKLNLFEITIISQKIN
jgi:hypothetical protein